ncbi:MAG: hypothetical protein HY038_01020 [Nitrospirae bacterium]|nr:hypothetical protein [Nitrospirota bacterium]
MALIQSVSEKAIEDVLSSDKTILSHLLSLKPANLSLVARQKSLASGELDLLYLHEDQLLLIEMKAVRYEPAVKSQINAYAKDLEELQRQKKLISAEIRKIVLVTGASPHDIDSGKKEAIDVVIYRPESVLTRFFENFRQRTYFMQLRSGDYGVVRLGLLKRTLCLLGAGHTSGEIASIEGKSKKTIHNRLSVAGLLGLAAKYKSSHFLTDFGISFVDANDESSSDRLNEKQAELIAHFLRDNPFYSSITYTVISILESVFALSKSAYPVSRIDVQDYFVKSVGKVETWRTPKARKTATYIFSNYACELDLLAKVGDYFYLTPQGIQAILLLQLNRSLKIIETQY